MKLHFSDIATKIKSLEDSDEIDLQANRCVLKVRYYNNHYDVFGPINDYSCRSIGMVCELIAFELLLSVVQEFCAQNNKKYYYDLNNHQYTVKNEFFIVCEHNRLLVATFHRGKMSIAYHSFIPEQLSEIGI